MDALQLIKDVPAPRKVITWDSTLTTLKSAIERFLSMSVHGMNHTFMLKKTGSRGETRVLTSIDLATVWLKVRVDEFAVEFS
jgi:hypothetical protein